MNGLELLTSFGIPQQAILAPLVWSCQRSDVAFQKLIEIPLRAVIVPSWDDQTRIPNLEDRSGILKGNLLLEVLSYRDIGKPLPLAKALEATGEETVVQFSPTRTLKLLLTDGTDRTFVAMEYEMCASLDSVRLGMKLQLRDVYYHHGVILLTASSVRMIGAPASPWQN